MAERNVIPDIKSLRLAHNWSQLLAAEYIGISRSYLAMVEEGKRKPSIATAKKIANTFGFEWYIFFDNAEIAGAS